MRTFLFGTKRRKVAAAIAVSALAAAGAAIAFWVVNGTGDTGAYAGQLQTPTFAPHNGAITNGDKLTPGGTGALGTNVTNPNAGALVLTAVTTAGAITSSDPSGCPASNVTFNPVSGLNIPINPGSDNIVKIPGAVSMSAAAPTACQNVSFTVPITASSFRTP